MRRIVAVAVGIVAVALAASAEDSTFEADFEDGFAPTRAVGSLEVTEDGATLTEADGAQALRSGFDGEAWHSLRYALTPEDLEAQKAGQLRPTFPLRRGTVRFDFRIDDWQTGSGDVFMLLHIRRRNGTLYVRCIEREGERTIQAIYGLLGNFPESDRRPKHFRTMPLPDAPPGHWYHVQVAWNSRWLHLQVDDEESVGSLADYMTPDFDGSRLDLGLPYPSSQSHHIRGHALIDNISISDEGPARASETEEHLPLVTVGRADGEIIADGTLDEPAWERAAMVTGFLTIGDNRYARHQPRVLLTRDDRSLHFAVESPVDPDAGLTAQARDRDDPVWQDDSIELHLDPTPETTDACQFVVNSLGTVFDQHYDAADRTAGEGPAWDCGGLQVGSEVGDTRWTLEMSVPFAGLGADVPGPGAKWLFNACETRTGLGAHALSAVRMYRERKYFGRLAFSDDTPVVRIRQIGQLRIGRLAIEASRVGDRAVDLLARGRRYDDTADTFFTLFTRSAQLPDEPRQAITVGPDDLGRGGVVELEAAAGEQVVYRGRLPYEGVRGVEIETMRVGHGDDTRRLIVRTVQPVLDGAERRARVRLVDADGRVAAEAAAPITTEKMDVPIDLADVAPGTYSARLAVIDAGGEIVQAAEHDREFEMFTDPPPWADCELGISDDVPPPWTPVEAEVSGDEVAVRCWGREYIFGEESLLPSRIISAGRDYLGEPAQVVLEADGERVATPDVRHRVTDRAAKRCVIASECSTDWGTLSAQTIVEFDGFIWTDLTLEPEGESEVQHLALQWRMPHERSTLLHAGYRSLKDVGATPKEFAKSLDQGQGPFWVGDAGGGIAFAVESFQHWRNTDPQRQVVVTREGGPATVTVTMIDQPGPMAGRTQFGFCLHPTPVRPRPDTFRELRTQSWLGYKCHDLECDPNFSPWMPANRYQSAPIWCVTDEDLRWYYEVAREKEYRECYSFEGLAESGIRSTWYSAYRCTARNSPGFIWGGNAWRKGDRDDLYGNALRGYYNDMVVVCKPRDFQNWYLWRLDRSRERYPVIDGVYLDLMAWDACSKEEHGHGWTDGEGTRPHTWPLRGHRQFLMRLYTYLKRDDPDTPVLLHLSGMAPKIMGYSFCDYLWTGELWIDQVQRDRSYQALSLDTMRAELLPRPWGPGKLWISQLGRALSFLPADERATGLQP